MKKLLLIFLMLFAVSVAQAQWLVPHGEEFTATATPNPGWQFVGWYDGDTFVSSENPYTWEVTSDIVLTARFERIMLQIQILIEPPGAGTVEVEYIGDITDGSGSVQIKAVANNPWWRFSHWRNNGEENENNPIVMENKPVVLAAVFRVDKGFWIAIALFAFAALMTWFDMRKSKGKFYTSGKL